jgi:uncharacterized membrane protein (DUF485 family)
MSSFNEASARLCVKALTHDDITMAIMYLSPVSFLSSFLSLSVCDLSISVLIYIHVQCIHYVYVYIYVYMPNANVSHRDLILSNM